MLKALCPLFLIPLVAACSTTPSVGDKRPLSPPEYRAEASYSTGRPLTSKHLPPSNARIRLEPSPGKIASIGNRPVETLESHPSSGAYVTTIGKTPITQYFEVVGTADCDKWIYLYLRSPAHFATSPTFEDYYLNPDYPEDKPVYKCIEATHAKFRANEDPVLQSADGVLFDPATAEFTGVDGLLIQNKKIFMRGWAIRFVDPTEKQIEARLATRPISKLEMLQTRAAIHWVEKNNAAARFTVGLRNQMPSDDPQMMRSGWDDIALAAQRTLASTSTAGELDIHRKLLEAGTVPGMSKASNGARVAVNFNRVGTAAAVSANILACNGAPADIDLLYKVMMESSSRQHALAAARALVAAGKTDLLVYTLRSKSHQLGNMYSPIADVIYRPDHLAFKCPYEA